MENVSFEKRELRRSGGKNGSRCPAETAILQGIIIWTMDDGRWTMDDGRWTMVDGRWMFDFEKA
ncbi:MAG: hypothetical protein IPM95_00525 [Sphingobacteriales bacterium]|nr:hypothetical protein [Sphingobacteriales bacterium]